MSKLFRLFVYGTLRSGFSNHERFCANAVSIVPACTFGSLYDLPYGYPAYFSPDQFILATGSANIHHDISIQDSTKVSEPDILSRKVVRGELISFADPEKYIPAIDYLEGFRPNADSLYDRVLIPVLQNDQWISSWTYEYKGAPRGKPVSDGNWRG